MKVTVISVMVGTFPKSLLKRQEEIEIRGQVETILITALLKSARVLKRVLETQKELLSFKML